MNIIDLATKTLQLAIQTAVNGVKTVVDSTKTKVDTIDTRTNTINTNVNTVNTNIGAPNTAANNALTANSHAKLNWLTANVGTLINGRVVKSTQRGTFKSETGNTGGTQTIPISTVSPNKCMVILNGTSSSNEHPVVSQITNNSLVLTNGSTFWSTAGTISWQVVEFY